MALTPTNNGNSYQISCYLNKNGDTDLIDALLAKEQQANKDGYPMNWSYLTKQALRQYFGLPLKWEE